MFSIDLNSDIGERLFYQPHDNDRKIIDLVSSANIACGWHSGDPMVIEETVNLCLKAGVAVGAHPSFPDFMGFGRRNMDVSEGEALLYIRYQLGAFKAIANACGAKVNHLKAHGALYNMAAVDPVLAKAIAEAVYGVDRNIILVGPSGSHIIKAGINLGLKIANEVFADRAYNSDGTLVPRNIPGALITSHQKTSQRMIRLIKTGIIEAIDGTEIKLKADTICVHSDTPDAESIIKSLRKELIENGIRISKLSA